MDTASISPVWALEALQNMIRLFLFGSTDLCSSPMVHLATAGPGVITPGWQSTDFTEADFLGYAAAGLLDPGLSVNSPSGLGQSVLQDFLFQCTSPPASPGQTIVGYWVDDVNVGPVLAELFPTPLQILSAGDYVNLALSLPVCYLNRVR
jgi:hypothetical protein